MWIQLQTCNSGKTQESNALGPHEGGGRPQQKYWYINKYQNTNNDKYSILKILIIMITPNNKANDSVMLWDFKL
jgi:hypothetical protein